jgi:glycosyltransferase involved in cell wall biosynthesis
VRVLLVHNRYRVIGGEERHIDLLEEWLPRWGIEVRRFEVQSHESDSLLERIRLGSTLAYRPHGAQLLRQALERERPDIVHFHNVFPLLTPAAIHEARRQGAAVVLTVHNFRFACPAGTLLRRGRIHEDCIDGSSLACGLRNSRDSWAESIAYGLAIELQRRFRMLHRWVDAYVAPSQFIAKMLERAGYPASRIHVIHHGVPVSELPSRSGPYALYAGRLSPEKGTATLLAAARLALSVPLVVAGTGPDAPLVTAAKSKEISYVGRVDGDTVSALLRGAFCALLPSQCYENQPLGALEALAVGTPLVASRLGGLPEIVQEGVTGILVPAGDPVALANAMRGLLHHPERAAAMGANSWKRARDEFEITRQVGLLSNLYQQLVLDR